MLDDNDSPISGGGVGGDKDAPHTAPPLHISGLAKTFNDRTVLQPFELKVQQGEIHALLGQNGSGKSTLIKILAGYHVPDEGGICLVNGQPLEFGSPQLSYQLGLRFVHQDLGLIASSSVADNLAFTRGYASRFGTVRSRIELERAERSLAGVGVEVSPRQLVGELTPAQRTGVAVARALDLGGGTAALLVLDEPTATLPTEEVEHLHSMLRVAAAQGIGILYVTHHLDEVFRLASQVSVLRDGYLVESCQVANIDRATIVHRLVGKELEAVQRTSVRSVVAAADATTLVVDGLESEFISGVSFEANSGEIVGIYGLTGSGRESLLGSVFGALPRYAGAVLVNGSPVPAFDPAASMAAGIGYLSPDRKLSGGFMNFTATENLTITNIRTFWRAGFLRQKDEARDARKWFERLQVSPVDGIRVILASFSGGNQQKLVLGKWLRISPKVLLLDEPTSGVDVGAKAELHRLILQESETNSVVVVSSSDVEELSSICDRVFIMRSGVIVAELTGEAVTETEINRSFHGLS